MKKIVFASGIVIAICMYGTTLYVQEKMEKKAQAEALTIADCAVLKGEWGRYPSEYWHLWINDFDEGPEKDEVVKSWIKSLVIDKEYNRQFKLRPNLTDSQWDRLHRVRAEIITKYRHSLPAQVINKSGLSNSPQVQERKEAEALMTSMVTSLGDKLCLSGI